MFVMAERAPENKKHRDVLESIISQATASASMAMATRSTSSEERSQNLSQYDILAVQSLLDLSAHQDPSAVSTPEDRPATSSTSTQGEVRMSTASSLGFTGNTDTAVPSPSDALWDQAQASSRSGRKLDAHGPFRSFMENLGSSDMLMTQEIWENDACNAQMVREMVAANGVYGGMWP